MNNLVSVIIPTFKRSECLIRAINSVLNQTYKNIEIIVVDDNDENSIYRKENEEKLKKYISSNKILFLKHKKNLNGANARNTGIRHSKGEFITFLDDDDYFYPTRIEKLVNLLSNNKSYDGAYSSVIFEDKQGNITNLLHAIKKGNLQEEVLKCQSFFGTGSNMFFRKKVVDKIGLFDKDFRRHQDIEYMVRFFEYSNIINIDDFLVVKSEIDNINKPNYQIVSESKTFFIKKFEKIINGYGNDVKKRIIVNHLYGLYNYAPKNEKKSICNKLESYGEKRYSIYLKNLKINLKKELKKNKFIKKIYVIIIGAQKYKKEIDEIKKEIAE